MGALFCLKFGGGAIFPRFALGAVKLRGPLSTRGSTPTPSAGPPAYISSYLRARMHSPTACCTVFVAGTEVRVRKCRQSRQTSIRLLVILVGAGCLSKSSYGALLWRSAPHRSWPTMSSDDKEFTRRIPERCRGEGYVRGAGDNQATPARAQVLLRGLLYFF